MTGFGRSEATVEGRALSLELKCVNSKQLDVSCKFPSRFRELEPKIKSEIAQKLVRGKVELYVNSEGGERAVEFNKEAIARYYETLKGIQEEISPDSPTDLFPLVLRMPEVSSVSRDALGEAETAALFTVLEKALSDLDQFRITEGQKITDDLTAQVEEILALLDHVAGLDDGRIERKRAQLMKRLEDLDVEHDESRLAQELVYYAEKLDVNEEKVRLSGHCEFFKETLNSSDIAKGKKLGFIAQEMGREINTLGSKANDADIQHRVVNMKECLEKIKEQVLNVL